MKVALIGPIYPFRGGIAQYTALLAMQLSKKHSVRVYSFRQQYPDWLFPGRSQYDPSVPTPIHIDANYWLIPWWPPTWMQVQQDWVNWQPEIIIIQWWVPFMAFMTAALINIARHLDRRVVILCHNVFPHEHTSFDHHLTRWALKNANQLLVHNTRDEVKARTLMPSVSVKISPLPSFGALHSSTWTREKARATLKIEGHILLFFGFVRPYKGLMDLLEALPNVETDVCLFVVGEIWGEEKLYKKRVADLGIVKKVRFVNRYVSNDEATLFFAAADLVVLPYREATGSAVLQSAFGMNIPVVATRTGGMDEVVEDGVTGFLVEPYDITGLASAITRFFIENRYSEFRSAIQNQAERFTWAILESAIFEK